MPKAHKQSATCAVARLCLCGAALQTEPTAALDQCQQRSTPEGTTVTVRTSLKSAAKTTPNNFSLPSSCNINFLNTLINTHKHTPNNIFIYSSPNPLTSLWPELPPLQGIHIAFNLSNVPFIPLFNDSVSGEPNGFTAVWTFSIFILCKCPMVMRCRDRALLHNELPIFSFNSIIENMTTALKGNMVHPTEITKKTHQIGITGVGAVTGEVPNLQLLFISGGRVLVVLQTGTAQRFEADFCQMGGS